MGDRNNLIKFGPEWLRNLSREGSATHSNASGSTPPNTSAGNQAAASANTQPKVHLAKLRYGREEILALYDRNVEPPAELKYFEMLYNPRGKAPLALNNTFEEDMRETMRSSSSSMGGMASGERMGMGRGNPQQGDGRGRGRSSFTRNNNITRGYKSGMTGQMGYPERGGDEQFEMPSSSNRSWSSGNSSGNTSYRTGADPNAEWMQTNRGYRGGQRWQGHTNWRRQVGRDEGEEWRTPQDPNKGRANPQEKWERDWHERGERGQSSRDNRNQSWNTNRRTWGGSNEDNLPEWAVDSAEACGGTFDSSGAFHGYSNDDTNLPKPPAPDPVYPLTRSHTQGSLTRAKVDEEGSDEWWASEKAKKLSPKRFDASEIKFKKQSGVSEVGQASSANEEIQSFPEKLESPTNEPKSEEKFGKKVHFKRSLVESKTYDGAKRSDVNLEDANDERGNFKSVIIAPNNILRQRHQNIVSSSNEVTRPNSKIFKSSQSGNIGTSPTSSASGVASAVECNNTKQMRSQEDKIMSDMLDFTLKDKDNIQQRSKEDSLVSGLMGFSFGEQDVVDIPLPPGPKPAKPAFSVSHGKGLPVTSSMSTIKPAGQHNTGPSIAAANVSKAPNAGLSRVSYQPSGKQTGSMASTISAFGNVGLGKSGLGTSGLGNSSLVGNSGIGHSTHGGLESTSHSGLGGLSHAGLGKSVHIGLGNQGLGNSSLSSLNNPVHGGLGNAQHSGIGSSAHSGLGSVGLGNAVHPGLGNSGLGNSQHAGLGNSQQAGLRNLPHAGLGNSSHTGLVSSSHAGLVNVSHGNSVHGVLGNTAHSGLGNSVHVTLGNSGLGSSGLGMPFGSANSALGMTSSGLSGSTAAPGASLTFTNSGSNTTGKNNLYMSQNNTNIVGSQTSDINNSQSKSGGQSMFQLHELQPQSPQSGFGSSVYGNVLPPPSQQQAAQTDMWFYEDPSKNIQGPFTSKEMYHWYRAGFFTSSLMVRRACDAHMQPLGSFGPVPPFAMDVLTSSFSNRLGARQQSTHDSILNPQSTLSFGNDGMNQMNLNEPALDNMQFGSVGNHFSRTTSFSQQPMDTLWGQSAASPNDLWLQPPMPQSRSDSRANNLNMFFWEQQPSVIASNSLLPKKIAKEMKTEDEILSQIRSSQNVAGSRTVPFVNQETQGLSVTNVLSKPEEPKLGATPDLGELEKLIQKDTLSAHTPQNDASLDNLSDFLSTHDKKNLNEESNLLCNVSLQNKTVIQQTKNKSDGEKAVVKKDTTSTKKKKSKDDKKDESTDLKKDEDCYKNEKAYDAPQLNIKKDDKTSKKEMEKEKKEWLKDGFTIVKGPEKSANKDKKKMDELKAIEEAERKRMEEGKLAVEREKKKVEILKRQEVQLAVGGVSGQMKAVGEGVARKAPWSAVSAQGPQVPSMEGLTLAEIQRLEREKKLEMMKEQQQQMMQMLAQQHQAQLAREQEVSQNVVGWAKKKGGNAQMPTSLSLAEIQAETRKQAAAAAAAAAAEAAEQLVTQALEQGLMPPSQPPWKSTSNASGGFWETERAKKKKQSAVADKPQDNKPAEQKTKKKAAAHSSAAAAAAAASNKPTAKKELTPSYEFEAWCNTSLSAWAAKIDVPTFVGFLKDIESPYEVKDYVKCYLGETKESNDFARHFLERRSKLLRASTVTPVDDLASPAAAINPRGGLDFQEGKGKKPKKNKMLKVDARILGFSVTAAQDRINVGDIDTA